MMLRKIGRKEVTMATTSRSRPRTRKPKPAEAPKPPSDQPTFVARSATRREFVPGRYLLRVHPEAVRPHVQARASARAGVARLALTANVAATVPSGVVEPLDYLRDNFGLKNVRPLFTEAGAGVATAKVNARQRDRLAMAASVVSEDDDDLAGLAICELDPKASSAGLAHAAAARAIDFIEPVPARWLAARKKPDPMENLQWGLRAIRWFEATKPNASHIGVGILDTGIDRNHPDLARVKVQYDHSDTTAEDIVGHGTHVAGIVAAETNNGVGIAGVASCALHSWKVFRDEPYEGEYYVDPDLFPNALRAASVSGLSVVNMSLGGSQKSRAEQLLIDRLVDRGVVVVAAMGNEYDEGNPTSYPAAYQGVLAVGAIAEDRKRSFFSNTGGHIGICAPGSNIFSTLPRTKSSYRTEKLYASWSGTSMATPHVAAAAALVAAADPSKGPSEIVEHLCKKAATLPAMKRKARTNEYGDGLLDLKRALS
jgi:subtilisin family serine protease